MTNNMEKFNYYVGCIFAVLQEEFPCRVSLDVLKIIGAEQCQETYSQGRRNTGLYLRNGAIEDISGELKYLFETVNWLIETGYLLGEISSTSIGKSAFATLSPKALEILKVAPSAINSEHSGKTIGEELSEAMNSAAKGQISKLASEALSYMFQIGWGALKAQHGL
jgi:hypothetical protein